MSGSWFPETRQDAQAGRDVYLAGRDLTVVNQYGLGTGQSREPGAVPGRAWNVPARNPGFTGRGNLLAVVRDTLASAGGAVVLALHGMGGVGKTQLAVEYAHRHAAEYDMVWWVAAEEPGLIGEQFAVLALSLGWTGPGADVPDARLAVLGRLRELDRWLLVFDNAGSPADLTAWLPGRGGHVLITSRARRWAEVAAPVEVDVLSRAESAALLRNRVPSLTAPGADQVADMVGDLPLALAQAAEFMAETGMPAEEYAGLVEGRAAEMLDEGLPPSYPQSLAAVTRLSAGRLRDSAPAAADLAGLCAFLAPAPVPASWFARAAGDLPAPLGIQAADPVTWRRVLAQLSRSALARVDGDELVMHRLTQAILRGQLASGQAGVMREAAGALLAANYPGTEGTASNWPGWARLLPHLLALARYPVALGNPRLRAMAGGAASYLVRRGDARAGHELARSLYQRWRDQLGPDDSATLHAAGVLAYALHEAGRHREARNLTADTLARCRRLLGDDHPDTLMAATSHAATLQRTGDVQAARQALEDILARRRRIFDEDHPSVLATANNLADALREFGDPRAARELDEDTLARRRRLLGDGHPDTLNSAGNLALDLLDMADFPAAGALLEETLGRQRPALGEDHPQTLRTAGNYAAVLHRLGKIREAHDLARDTLARYRRGLGDDHPDTIRAAINVATGLRALGNREAARDLDQDTLAALRRTHGEDHPKTLGTAINLAVGLRELGEWRAARELDEDTLARCRHSLGEDHPQTLIAASNLALDLRALGDHQAARDLNADTLARRRRTLGGTHPDTQRSARSLAADLHALGQASNDAG